MAERARQAQRLGESKSDGDFSWVAAAEGDAYTKPPGTGPYGVGPPAVRTFVGMLLRYMGDRWFTKAYPFCINILNFVSPTWLYYVFTVVRLLRMQQRWLVSRVNPA